MGNVFVAHAETRLVNTLRFLCPSYSHHPGAASVAATEPSHALLSVTRDNFVIPAKAGIQSNWPQFRCPWIPAFAPPLRRNVASTNCGDGAGGERLSLAAGAAITPHGLDRSPKPCSAAPGHSDPR